MTDHDLAVLADWAGRLVHSTPNKNWKRAYALIREGSDLLLRRRARSSDTERDVISKEKAFKALADSSLGNPIENSAEIQVSSGGSHGLQTDPNKPSIPIVQLERKISC